VSGRRPAPTREQILAAVEVALDSALVEVDVRQDGQPSTLYRLVHVLDNAGLIDWRGVPNRRRQARDQQQEVAS
jgi:Fe2+ or Zn2+ uptake regulation protein